MHVSSFFCSTFVNVHLAQIETDLYPLLYAMIPQSSNQVKGLCAQKKRAFLHSAQFTNPSLSCEKSWVIFRFTGSPLRVAGDPEYQAILSKSLAIARHICYN